MPTRVKIAGKYIEIRRFERPILKNYAKTKATKEHNKYLREVLGYEPTKNEVKQKRDNNLTRVRSRLNLLVWANSNPYTKFITLTTQENIKDLSLFQKHLHHWFKGIQRQFNEPLRYVGVYEYQERGALHLHLFMFNQKRINWKKAYDSWLNIIKGKGTVRIGTVKEHERDRTIKYCLSYISNSTLQEFGRKSLLVSQGLQQPIEYDHMPTTLPYKSVALSFAKYIATEYNDFEVYTGLLTNKADNGLTIANLEELETLQCSVMSKRMAYWYKHKKFPK